MFSYSKARYKKRYGGSDLATERRRADLSCDGVNYKKERCPVGIWERIRITTEEGAKSIQRPIGSYDTLTLPRMDMLEPSEIEDVKEEIARELCRLADSVIQYPERILVVGLGNPDLTPDAVGTECAKEIYPTMQIMQFDDEMFNQLECSELAVIAPSVSGKSGIESSVIVKGVCEKIKPDLVIAVDSLASRSVKRLGTTIQLCDTGIHAGSGVGSHVNAIDEKALGIPVIAIGVPTVIDSMQLIDGEEAQEEAENQKK